MTIDERSDKSAATMTVRMVTISLSFCYERARSLRNAQHPSHSDLTFLQSSIGYYLRGYNLSPDGYGHSPAMSLVHRRCYLVDGGRAREKNQPGHTAGGQTESVCNVSRVVAMRCSDREEPGRETGARGNPLPDSGRLSLFSLSTHPAVNLSAKAGISESWVGSPPLPLVLQITAGRWYLSPRYDTYRSCAWRFPCLLEAGALIHS